MYIYFIHTYIFLYSTLHMICIYCVFVHIILCYSTKCFSILCTYYQSRRGKQEPYIFLDLLQLKVIGNDDHIMMP